MHLTRTQWLQALTLALLPPQPTAKILTTAPDPTTPSLTYSITIPSTNTSTLNPSEDPPRGSGPIYLRLTAPTTMQWISLGQGPDMATANIFIVYAASATSVTLSPRSGGQGQPRYNPAVNVTLLEGSGIVDGMMVAEVRCEDCWGSWPALPTGGGDGVEEGGEVRDGAGTAIGAGNATAAAATGATAGGGFVMDPNGNETAWFWAYQLGAPLNSDDVGAELGMHDVKGEMVWDLREARFEVGTGDDELVEGSDPFI